ncbi:MAG: phage tail length tape measure family protein [Alphaproteobacteria bacterium]
MSDLIARLKLTADGREFIAALKQAGVAVDDLGAHAQKASGGAKALDAASASTSASLQNMAARAGPLGAALGVLGPFGLAAAAGIGALTLGLKASLSAAAEAEKLELRLGAVLRATGQSAGFTKAQLLDYSSELQSSLKIDDEAITQAATVMATFRAVSGDTFKQSIALAADMSAVFGGDLTSSTLQLGKALQDPVAGISALQRVGVTFTAQQKDLIQSLMDTGDAAGAQAVILKELENQVGGAAKAEAGGLSGAARNLDNQWDDFLKTLGRTPAVGGVAKSALDLLSSAIEGVTAALAGPRLDEEIRKLQAEIAPIEKSLTFVDARQPKIIPTRLIALREELQALQDSQEITTSLNVKAAERAKAGAAAAANAQLQLKWNKDLEDMLKDAGEESKKRAREDAEAAQASKKFADEKTAGLKEEKDLTARIGGLLDDDLQKQAARNALVPDYIAALREETRLAALTGVAREQENAVLEISNQLKLEGLALSKEDETVIRGQVAQREAVKAAIADAQAAAEQSAKAWDSIWEHTADNIQDSLSNGFKNVLKGGVSDFQDFGEAVLDIMIDVAAEIAAALVFRPVVGGVFNALGLAGAAGQSASGGGSGALGLASTGLSLANFFSGGSLSSGIGAKLIGTAAFTGPLETMSATGTAGLLGSGGAASSLAAAAPYAAAAVAVFLAARQLNLFGGNTVGSNAGGRVEERGGLFFAAGIDGDRNRGTDLIPQVTQTLATAAEALNAFVTALGEPQTGSGAGVALQLFESGKNAINITVDDLVTAASSMIEGLSEAERAIIANGDALDGMAQVLTDRAVKTQFGVDQAAFAAGVSSAVLQREDPKAFAIQQAVIERDGMLARAQELQQGAEVLTGIETLHQHEMADIAKRFGAGIDDGSAAIAQFTQYMDALAVKASDLAAFRTGVSDLLLQDKDPEAFAALRIDREEQDYLERARVLNAGAQTILEIEEHFAHVRAGIVEDSVTAIAAANDNMDQFNGQIAAISNGANEAAQALQATADSLTAFLAALDLGPLSALSIGDQYATARAQFTENASAETARSLLEISRKFDPGHGFQADSRLVRDTLSGIISGTPDRISGVYAAANAQIAGMQAQREAQRIAVLAAQASDIFWDLRRTAGASEQDSFARILKDGGTFRDLTFGAGFNRNVAELEGFANGGKPRIDRAFLAGEGGQPEIIMPAGQQLRVYNGATGSMLDSGPIIEALGAEGAATRRQSQDETLAMLKMLGELVQQQGRIIADLQLERSQVRRVA